MVMPGSSSTDAEREPWLATTTSKTESGRGCCSTCTGAVRLHALANATSATIEIRIDAPEGGADKTKEAGGQLYGRQWTNCNTAASARKCKWNKEDSVSLRFDFRRGVAYIQGA